MRISHVIQSAALIIMAAAFADHAEAQAGGSRYGLMIVSDDWPRVAVDNVCAWPNLTLLPDGSIAAIIFNRPSHGLEEGDVDCYVSRDEGMTWEYASTVTDHEPGTVRMNHAAGLSPEGDLMVLCSGWGGRSFREYILPVVVCRSPDGGKTWDRSFTVDLPPNMPDLIPYGDIFRVDGETLAAAAYDGFFARGQNRAWLLFSRDNGLHWGDPVLIGDTGNGYPPTGRFLNFNETAVLPLGGRRWIAAARRYVASADIQLLVSDSGGRFWNVPEDMHGRGLTGRSEHPGDLTELPDGRILLTYGIRHGERGLGGRISADGGRTWGDPFVVITYGGKDGGYPSSMVLEDGSVLTAYYSDANRYHDRYHMGVVRWRPPR